MKFTSSFHFPIFNLFTNINKFNDYSYENVTQNLSQNLYIFISDKDFKTRRYVIKVSTE